MEKEFLPEGGLLDTAENRAYLSSPMGLERAMNTGEAVEGIATRCDEALRLHVDLHCVHGIIEPEEAVFCREGEARKDIAILTRVGKPVSCRVTAIEHRDGELIAHLSRRAVQRDCMAHYLRTLRAGDLLDARVTHMEPFGAFLDIGCGVTSLLSVDAISVSRIAHPRERLACGMHLPVIVRSVNPESERIYTTLKELLGTWEENVKGFEAGQTVTGIVRSVESYGVFVELTPNLAGLAEVRAEEAEFLKGRIGQSVAVYVKSISPERMKIKLVLIDPYCTGEPPRSALRFFSGTEKTKHIDVWRYSPDVAYRTVETRFDNT